MLTASLQHAFQGSLKDTVCPFETWLFSTKMKGTHHLQGNAQVYNVRIVFFCVFFFVVFLPYAFSRIIMSVVSVIASFGCLVFFAFFMRFNADIVFKRDLLKAIQMPRAQ